MAEPGQELIDRIQKLIEDHGVRDYVVAFSDPDSEYDRFIAGGSRFWRCGVAMDLIEEVKEMRRKEREEGEE
jgi:hypothetical protein